MNKKDKAEWLRGIRSIDAELKELEAEYREVMDNACRITAKYSAGISGGSGEKHRFDSVAEYSERIMISREKLMKEKREILSAVEALEDPDQRCLLILRYVRGYQWQKVAQRMHYSESMTYIIHRKALKALQVPDSQDCSSL